ALSPTYSATTSSPPQPQVWARKGNDPNNGCTGPNGCHYIDLETNAQWKAGDYYISCQNDGREFSNNAGYKFHIPSGRRVQLPCWIGYTGTKRVVITGGNPGVSQTVYW